METIPAAVNDYLATIPQLARVTHSRLRQLELVHFGLEPVVLLSVENEDIVYYSFFAVTLSAPKNNQILSKLGRRLAVPRAWRLPINLQTRGVRFVVLID